MAEEPLTSTGYQRVYRHGHLLLEHERLRQRGIEHGFSGRSLAPGSADREEMRGAFKREFGVDTLHLPKQVHGSVIWEPELGGAECEADGLVFQLAPARPPGARVAFGVRSADCLPLLVVGERHGALIHAGWRGLAGRIISKTLSALRARGEKNQLEAFLGPAADADLYEVGAEVITEIGEFQVSRR